ncbi:glycine cleavage system aminomethyltransferase GcvT [Jeotgalibacillus terrae]|uniref:Aminomethyltransferase n=1 Tax=Jeotgalibacillus terrae TaxID=587735 RepID=A0ABW5ZJJ1_9BACL|nr:glycine cleavage system aminomethyltransferase GcvT [Jeotgalibacillus terrae]MBM7577569.1 aminomethyltransferase [Jeotgalibacillus terrae]
MNDTLKKTPLYDSYKALGGKVIDFGGWALPVQFSSIKEEHHAVRNHAGLFDVSHMGEVTVKGPSSLAYLQKMMTNDISKIKTGQAQYTAMCYENGGTVDDLLVYKKDENDYLLVINASNNDKDTEWLLSHQMDGVEIVNISDQVAQLAIQGPRAEKILQTCTEEDLSLITFFKFKDDVNISGSSVLVSRTGYTGEDGFELYCSPEDAEKLWAKLLEAGKEEGLLPCGLGARDTLRFEAKLALYGQELTADITPIEAGIGFAVKPDKEAAFIGQEVLKEQKDHGAPRKLVGIEMIDKGIPRHGYKVFADEKEIGFVTTGTQSPTLGKNVGYILIEKDYSSVGQEVYVEVRKKKLKAEVVKSPFYKR